MHFLVYNNINILKCAKKIIYVFSISTIVEVNVRINSVNNIKFGYDKTYHDQLHKRLAARKKDKIFADELLKLDSYSLQLEDEIVNMEKSKTAVKSIAYKNLIACLSDVKNIIAFYLSSVLPSANYADSLIDQYSKEADLVQGNAQKAWRELLCMQLNTFSNKPSDVESAKIETPDENEDKKSSTENGIVFEQDTKPKAKPQNNLKCPDVLTEFVPIDTTPKGFLDVAGYDDQKDVMKEQIIDYINNPQQLEIDKQEYGISLPRGYLFYGPPGCGKTFLTEALASEAGLKMYKMDVSKVGSLYVNQTANNIEKAFDYLARLSESEKKPILLFMDEVDSLASKRNGDPGSSREDLKSTTTILRLINSSREKGIIVIAATNQYDLLDEAFVSRFDNQQYFGLPDSQQRIALLKNSLSKRKKGEVLASNDDEIKKLARSLEGYSNRSIVFIVDEAAKIAKRRNRSDISAEDIIAAEVKLNFDKVDETKYGKTETKKLPRIGFSKV